MKKQLFVFAGLIVITLALVSWNNASKFDGATVINDIGCLLFDENENLVWATSDHRVMNTDGAVTKCSVKKFGNSTGKAIEYAGFLCVTLSGLTNDSKETISASGNATLTCTYANVNP